MSNNIQASFQKVNQLFQGIKSGKIDPDHAHDLIVQTIQRMEESGEYDPQELDQAYDSLMELLDGALQ